MARVFPTFKKFTPFKQMQRRASYDVETQQIILALKQTGGNRTRAAQLLGYPKGSRSSLYRAIDFHPEIREELARLKKPLRRR